MAAAMAAAPSIPCVCPGHTKGVVELYYTEGIGGGAPLFISACLDKLPMLRDAVTGDWLGTFEGHKGAVWSAKLNRDATLAATAAADFTVKVWDATTGSLLQTLEHNHVVRCVDFSQGNSHLATGGQDKKLRIFQVSDFSAGGAEAKPIATFPQPDKIKKLLWLSGDKRILLGTEEGVLRMLDAATGAVIAEASTGAGPATGGVMDLELSKDGSTVTVAAGDSVLLYKVAVGAAGGEASGLVESKRIKTSYTVETASLHPNGKHILAGGGSVNTWVFMYDAESGAEVSCQKGHHGAVHALRFSRDGSTYASGADDATIRLWKYEAGGAAAGAGSA